MSYSEDLIQIAFYQRRSTQLFRVAIAAGGVSLLAYGIDSFAEVGLKIVYGSLFVLAIIAAGYGIICFLNMSMIKNRSRDGF